jgi:hypothetical protein
MDELLAEVKDALAYAERVRGHTTDEDLAENLIYRLRAMVEKHDAE